MKHTKGPWRATHLKTEEAPNNLVHDFQVFTDPDGEHDNGIGLANARLIAAAPELYEAAVIACVEFYDQTNAEPTNKNHWYWKLKEAITKATQL